MTKVVRLNHETYKMLEEYRTLFIKNLDVEIFRSLIENDNHIIQCALREAIWYEKFQKDRCQKSKYMD